MMKIGVVNFGVGAGEGLAAVCGHQFGVKGCWLRCPYSPWEIEAIGSFDSASRHQLRFLFGRSKLRPSRCGALGERALPVGGLKDEV